MIAKNSKQTMGITKEKLPFMFAPKQSFFLPQTIRPMSSLLNFLLMVALLVLQTVERLSAVHKSFDIVCSSVSCKPLLTKGDDYDDTESVTEKINPQELTESSLQLHCAVQ